MCLVATTCFAQKEVVGKPYSFNHSVSMNIEKVELPVLDIKALETEDAMKTAKDGTPMRVGVSQRLGYNFNNSGRMDILPDGSRLWRLSVKSPDALMLTAYFTKFNIPEGASFYIYSGDYEQLTGKYDNNDVQQNGYMVSENIMGDEIVFEYYEPANALFHGVVELESVSHYYKNFLDIMQTRGRIGYAEGDCHYDVVCPEGNGWRMQAKSVVCITIHCPSDGNDYMCSGAMINNVRQDKTPYVYSADHCLNSDTNSTFKFYFNYQALQCGGNAGYSNRVANGGVIRCNANLTQSADFLLLEITGNLSATFRDSIVFAGWDANGAASAGAAIHHPGGDFKKISFPKSVSSYGKYWNVGWYTNPNRGCTEQGSSGSPLFNASGLIIGSLSNGSSACDYPQGKDNYGKLSEAWTNNNNSNVAKKMQPWLDPDNTGTKVLGPMNYDGTPATGVNDYAPVMNFNIAPNPSNGNVTITGSFGFEDGVCNIYDAMGRLVNSSNIALAPSFNMDLSDLNNGIYFMEILSNNNVYKSKVVIAR